MNVFYFFEVGSSGPVSLYITTKKRALKQINTLKPFDMESLNASREKYFVSEAKNNCEQEINLTSEYLTEYLI